MKSQAGESTMENTAARPAAAGAESCPHAAATRRSQPTEEAAPAPASDAAPGRTPPGPRGWPWVGSGLGFWRDPIGFLTRGSDAYGDALRFTFGPSTVTLFRHPDQIKAVLQTQQHLFVKGGAGPWFRSFAGQGLFTSEGELHRRQRRLAQPAFHRQRIEGYAPIMTDYTARTIASWRDGELLDVSEQMRDLTMTVVSSTVFGVDLTGQAKPVGEALTTIMKMFPMFTSLRRSILKIRFAPPRLRFDRAKRQLDETIYRIIAIRRAGDTTGPDFLSTLLAARDEDGRAISDEQLRDELVTLFIAGHETAANAMAWTWYLLSQHPDVEARLHEEIDRVLDGRVPVAADVPALPYATDVVAEALRLYPPLWVIGRRPLADIAIDGYALPSGSIVVVSPFITQRDPRFFEQPLAFRPERWTPAMRAALPKFAYFPFSGGARQCLGDGFAWLEAVLVLATVARQWRLRLAPGHRAAPEPLATLRPLNGMPMRLERRRP